MSTRPVESEFVMPSLRLDGRVALVTGGGRGLGLGMALALAHAGADVAIAARTPGQVDQATALVSGLDRRTLGLPTDVTDDDAPQRLVDAVLGHFGRLDVLVHAAGINIRKPALDLSPAEVDRVLRVNVHAPFRLSQAAAPTMKSQGRGRIIAVTSVSSEVAIPRVSAYAMSKGALRQMVRALAVEWARDGITVNAIAPGRFWTAMTDAIFSDERLHAGAVRVIPMGRPGVAADLAGATVLLASDASAYITGQTIVIDGGWLAGGGVEG